MLQSYKVFGKDFTVLFEKQYYFLPKIEQTVQMYPVFLLKLKNDLQFQALMPKTWNEFRAFINEEILHCQ